MEKVTLPDILTERLECLNSLYKLSCDSLNQALILINDYLRNIPLSLWHKSKYMNWFPIKYANWLCHSYLPNLLAIIFKKVCLMRKKLNQMITYILYTDL